MSPNSRASLIRSATSRRLAVESSSSSVLELLQPFGGEDDVLRHMSERELISRLAARLRDMSETRRVQAEDAPAERSGSERSSIASSRALKESAASAGDSPRTLASGASRDPGVRRTTGRTCAGSGRRAARRGARRRGRSSSRARPAPRARVGASSRQPEQLLEQPRVAKRAAREHHGRGAGLLEGRERVPRRLRPPVRITGASSVAHERGGELVVGTPCGGRRAERGWNAIAATPASRQGGGRARSRSCSPGRRPERSLTVTGRPLPSRAARATATATSGSPSSAAPAPVLQTFGTGQPMLRSIASAPALRDARGGRAHDGGSCAEQLDRDRPAVALARVDAQHLATRALVAVKDGMGGDHLRDDEAGAVALGLQAHEPVADASQRREHDAVGNRSGPSCQGSVRRVCHGPLLCDRRSCPRYSRTMGYGGDAIPIGDGGVEAPTRFTRVEPKGYPRH